MNIQVLMSTMNRKEIKDLELDKKNISNCLIINQTLEYLNPIKNDKYAMISYNERGLAKSRNRLLENVSDDVNVGIITDDDVEFIKGYSDIVDRAYSEYPDADIIIFKSLDEYGKERRDYPSKSKKLTKKDILNVCSIEISFKISSIKNNISFDEKFGLGSKYKSGEENIFLNDCYNKKMNIYFYNEAINIHQRESTGSTWKEKDIFDKGALFKRLYPHICYFMVVPIAIVKNRICETNFIKTIFLLLNGIKDYKKEEIK